MQLFRLYEVKLVLTMLNIKNFNDYLQNFISVIQAVRSYRYFKAWYTELQVERFDPIL